MNQLFDAGRWWLLVGKHWSENRKKYSLSLIAIAGLLLLFFFVIIVTESHSIPSEIQLNTYYKNAMALLIPLRPTLQDKARFPHKIGEYLASGNPVVSTNYGEVSYYFKDEQNMLIAESYDIKLFAAKMQFVLEHTSEAQKIGANGKDLALNQFEYKQYGDRIIDFLNQLNLNGKNH